MWNVLCPVCRKRAIPKIVKVMLGPAKSVPCQACGAGVGVSAVPLLAGVVLFVAFVLTGALPDTPFLSTRLAVGTMVAIVVGWGLWFAMAPLVRRDDKSEDRGDDASDDTSDVAETGTSNEKRAAEPGR